jgi:RimJ/RimL family protein N-acetyltransferase
MHVGQEWEDVKHQVSQQILPTGAAQTVVETERLMLRKLTLDDAEFMLRLLNEPSFITNIGDRKVRTIEQARDYIMTYPFASYEQFNLGPYLIQSKETSSSIGICGYRKRESLEFPDIGYALLPEYCGQGYALEASIAVLRYGREFLRMTDILGLVNPDNSPSIRLLEKLGFTFLRAMRLEAESAEVHLYISGPPIN